MSSTQFWTGMVVPPFLKWINPYLKKFFRLKEIDSETKARVSARQYPAYFGLLYGLWVIALFSTGFITLLWFIISGQIFLGLINMVGGWLIGGAILNFLFWQISTLEYHNVGL